MTRLALFAAPLLLLAACGEDAESPAGQGGAAAGEVLEGSISDAMIPYDQLRSQPPLAEIVPEAGASPRAAGAPASAEDAEAAEAAQPAVEETPEEGE